MTTTDGTGGGTLAGERPDDDGVVQVDGAVEHGVAARGVPAARGAAEPVRAPGDRSWQALYATRLKTTDALVMVAVLALTELLRAASSPSWLDAGTSAWVEALLVLALLAGWWGVLGLYATRDSRVLGTGGDEYRRVADGTARFFGIAAIVLVLVGHADSIRAHLLLTFPLGVLGLLSARILWCRWLVRRRRVGTFSSTVLVVGSHRSAVTLARTLHRDPAAGFQVVGACVPGHGKGNRRAGDRVVEDAALVPVLGDEHAVIAALGVTGADTVVVTATEQLGPAGMRALAWELQAVGVELAVTPGVVDVAGQRLRIRPMSSVPMVHVAEPQYEGAARARKLLLDWAIAGSVLVATSPLLLAAAVAVKVTSPGPVFYRAERIGKNGAGFPMLKLRSMVVDADTKVAELVSSNEGAGPLFKMRGDPRITPVGKFLRKFSIDELPQLWNVLRGEMSIVGPRPPLRREVETYTGEVHRRLLVKPGITGLWQVSGRSDLSWDESVRLDLSYVENWSMTADLGIVARTLKAVLVSDGAY